MANIAHYSGQEMRLKENPLVSVVIPMFNAEDWIVGLMHSILNQSYKNIEVILLNDGSTDASVELVSKAAQEFGQNRVRIITQNNSGVSAARNEGVRNSTGELIAFVDSDDVWFKRKIEHQVNAMTRQNLAASACSYAIFTDSDLEILDVVHPDWSTNGVRNWLLFRSYGGLLSSTLMLRREVFYETGPFRLDLSLSADIEFAWRLLRICSVKLIREPLVGYRLRPNQMHKSSDLLISESNTMLKTVPLLQDVKYARIYLANLYLRLFLYRAQEKDFRNSLHFLQKAIVSNFNEACITSIRIISKRSKRKFKHIEKKSILLPMEKNK
jgi:glycosyltransferase involved in cell wall biosynthesis